MLEAIHFKIEFGTPVVTDMDLQIQLQVSF